MKDENPKKKYTETIFSMITLISYKEEIEEAYMKITEELKNEKYTTNDLKLLMVRKLDELDDISTTIDEELRGQHALMNSPIKHSL